MWCFANNTSCQSIETIRECDVFAFNNTFCCYCFYCNEIIRRFYVLLLTIPVVSVSIAMKLLENVMFCF